MPPSHPRRSAAIREAFERDGWARFAQESQLGEVLTGGRKYAEGEQRLRSGYEGLKSRADGIPPVFGLSILAMPSTA